MYDSELVTAVESVLAQCLPIGCGAAVCCADADPAAEILPNAARQRRREYAAGRVCAVRALEQIGYRGGGDLQADADGVPIWPAGTLGSITHSKGLCAAVAGACAVQLLGVDLERTDRLRPAAIRRVVHPREEVFVRDDRLRATLLFSLKEAFYKAQFPRWRSSANFSDLALELDLDAGHARVLEIGECFDAELIERADALNFRFAVRGGFACSLCWL